MNRIIQIIFLSVTIATLKGVRVALQEMADEEPNHRPFATEDIAALSHVIDLMELFKDAGRTVGMRHA